MAPRRRLRKAGESSGSWSEGGPGGGLTGSEGPGLGGVRGAGEFMDGSDIYN